MATRAPLVQQHRVRVEIVDAGEGGPIANRPVNGRRGDAEHAFDLIEQLEGIEGGLVQLVDEGQYRQPAGAAHLEELERLRLDALGRVEHHHDAVDCQERPVGVFAEVLVARRVEQRDMVPVQLELERGGADRNAALLLHLHPVGDGVPLRPASPNGARQLDGSGVQEQFFGQRRLARVGVGNDGERAAPGHFTRQRVSVACEFAAGRGEERGIWRHCTSRPAHIGEVIPLVYSPAVLASCPAQPSSCSLGGHDAYTAARSLNSSLIRGLT